MDWKILVFITAFFLGMTDFFIKLGANTKTNPVLSGLVFSIVATIITATYFVYMKYCTSATVYSTKTGIVFATLAGLFVAVAQILFFIVYAKAPASIVIPAVKVGALLFVALLGIIILKDDASMIKILGFLVSIAGIYLLLK